MLILQEIFQYVKSDSGFYSCMKRAPATICLSIQYYILVQLKKNDAGIMAKSEDGIPAGRQDAEDQPATQTDAFGVGRRLRGRDKLEEIRFLRNDK